MYKKVLVPISSEDKGQRSIKALDKAIQLCDGELIILHVTDAIPQVVGGDAREELEKSNHAQGLAILGPAIEILEAAKKPFHTRILGGTPAETIIKVANDENADLIVMYTDGRDELGDIFLGSITERVLRNTGVDLLALRI